MPQAALKWFKIRATHWSTF